MSFSPTGPATAGAEMAADTHGAAHDAVATATVLPKAPTISTGPGRKAGARDSDAIDFQAGARDADGPGHKAGTCEPDGPHY